MKSEVIPDKRTAVQRDHLIRRGRLSYALDLLMRLYAAGSCMTPDCYFPAVVLERLTCVPFQKKSFPSDLHRVPLLCFQQRMVVLFQEVMLPAGLVQLLL